MKQPSYNTDATYPPRLYLLPSLAPPRRTLSPRIGYAVAALVVGLGLFASVTPSPLYRSYSVLWRFSPLTLTLIYATYAFGVLASLLLAGGVSDDVGRRPVLLVALGALMASSVLFMVAESVAWLFVARGLQGLATGAALSAAGAAREAWPLPPHGRAPTRPGCRAPSVLAGRSGGALLMVNRWPLLLARPAAGRSSLQLEQRDRLRQRHRGTRRCGCRCPAADRAHRAVDRRRRRLDRTRRRNGADRLRCRPRLERRLPGRLDPRRPARARRGDPAARARGSDVGLLRRRLHLPLPAGRPRRRRRRTRRVAYDLRALWRRRRRDRSDRRLRSLAHPSYPAARCLADDNRSAT